VRLLPVNVECQGESPRASAAYEAGLSYCGEVSRMEVWLYNRVSRDPKGVSRSVAQQEELGLEWAAREGWTVTRILSETASASKYARKERQEWVEVMDGIRARAMDAIMCWEASRSTRDLQAYLDLRLACAPTGSGDPGVLWAYSGQVFDLSKPSDQFRTGLDALLAEQEAAQTRARILRDVERQALKGAKHGKNLWGYSYRRSIETGRLESIEPDEKPVTDAGDTPAGLVKEAFHRLYDGESAYQVAADWNRRGVPPRRPVRNPKRANAGWTTEMILEVALKPAYAGLREFRGEVLDGVEAQWPALVDRTRWWEFRARHEARPRRDPNEWKIAYLLSGIAECGAVVPGPDGELTPCGAKLIRAKQNRGRQRRNPDDPTTFYNIYVCKGYRTGQRSGMGHVTVSMKHLDDLVEQAVIARLSDPEFLARADERDMEVSASRAALQERLAKAKAYMDEARRESATQLDMSILRTARDQVQPEIDRLERRLRQTSGYSQRVLQLAGSNAETRWQSYTLLEKRGVIADLVVPVVHRAPKLGVRGGTRDRVTLDWIRP